MHAIPKGLTREDVLAALAELDAGVEHPFGKPTGYELFFHGKSYPPKAVIGLAFRHHSGRLLAPDEFSGGNGPGQANYVLRSLGFTVVSMADDWSESEVDLIVADYFQMLRAELLGQAFNKSEHRQRLAPSLNDRSKGSIEFKHQNISAVLVERGLGFLLREPEYSSTPPGVPRALPVNFTEFFTRFQKTCCNVPASACTRCGGSSILTPKCRPRASMSGMHTSVVRRSTSQMATGRLFSSILPRAMGVVAAAAGRSRS